MAFYTNVSVSKNRKSILLRGYYNNGKPIKEIIPYKPKLYLPTTEKTNLKTLSGSYVKEKKFDTISQANWFMKENKDVHGFKIYGMTNYEYVFINESFKDKIKYKQETISIVFIDIETKTDGKSFPDPMVANQEITAITISKNKKRISFGYVDFVPLDKNTTYYKFCDEVSLLNSFLEILNGSFISPDILTGHNISGFDLPYLVNRIENVLGVGESKRLSPWHEMTERNMFVNGKQTKQYMPTGISVLDYLDLYKKWGDKLESYSLDNVCFHELGANKIDYREEYETLDNLYRLNPQLYFEYNLRDVTLLEELEDKCKFIELIIMMAYDAKVNFSDMLKTVKPWDVIIHNYLWSKNIVVPNEDYDSKVDESFSGGFVKEPQKGSHEWVMTFDVDSEYPHVIMGTNIGAETYAGRLPDVTVDELLENPNKYKDYLIRNNLSLAANGTLYKRDRKSVYSILMESGYNERKEFKANMLNLLKEYEETKSKNTKKESDIFKNKQKSKKTLLASAYGAISNKNFRYYDIKVAEAITHTGQLTIRYIGEKLNNKLNELCNTTDIDYIIYSDTDSCFVSFEKYVKSNYDGLKKNEITKKLVELAENVIQPYISSSFEELAVSMNSYEQKISMKLEKISSRAIFLHKKKYILNNEYEEGVYFHEPKLKMTGIEAIRTSTPKICRDVIKNSIKIMLNGNVNELNDMLKKFREEYQKFSFQDIAYPRGISDLDKYFTHSGFKSATPIHVKGALLYNRLLEKNKVEGKYRRIYSGDKIRFVQLIEPNPYDCNCLSFHDKIPAEFKIDKYVDVDDIFEKSLIKPLSSISTVIGWDLRYKQSLMDFFD